VDAPASSGLILTVSDTGTGIAPHDLDHVFDRFYKADPARSHGGSGRSGGLGLAICRSIVESSGGTIGIASRLGEGTTVTVRLPAGLPATASPQSPQPAAVPLVGAAGHRR
jgi:signal transduction histidine kinase